MTDKEYLKTLIPDSFYLIVTTWFLISLNNLNEIIRPLVKKDINAFQALKVLQYDNYKPLVYFFSTLILEVIGGLLIYWSMKFLRYYAYDQADRIISLLGILVILCLMVMLIVFIKNPILKLILIVIFAGGLATAWSES